MEGESGVTRSITDEFDCSDIQGDQMEGETMVFLEVSLMNLVLGMSIEIKWKFKVMLLKVSWMNFILRISKDNKWKVKLILLEVSLMTFILRISKEVKW